MKQAIEQDLCIEKGQAGIAQVKLPTYIKVLSNYYALSIRPSYLPYAFNQVCCQYRTM